MKKPVLDAEIKVRVTVWVKNALEALAGCDELELSDEVRRALKEYVTKRTSQPA